MDVAAFLKGIESGPTYRRQMVAVEYIPPRKASYGEPTHPLHPSLRSVLERRSMWPLYLHQAESIDRLSEGGNVVVATPAASGKSLCYHLPVIHSVLEDRSSKAIYIYPTKALAQDQLRSLKELAEGLRVQAAVYDGDTPHYERSGIRNSAHIVMTNPDMLHMGILPNHRAWSRLLRSLRYIVLDEAHTYRGVFGSHIANVVRRLRRLCSLYGSHPRFILCSATIANPRQLAEQLTGLPFDVVDEDGAPSGGKSFVFWNPPLRDMDTPSGSGGYGRPSPGFRGMLQPIRSSANMEAATLLADLVVSNVRTVAFVRTRRAAELVYGYAREHLDDKQADLRDKIRAYKGSYMAEERRAIERALFDGELTGVAATNALELGIDVGSLDATIITGYPGSIASTWQQAGRSGRRGEESLSVFIGRNDPLDQYFINHPDIFFRRSVEAALLSPANPHILRPHLLCAAYEMPLSGQDAELFGRGVIEHLEDLLGNGLLKYSEGKWHIAPHVSYPAEEVNIRSASSSSYHVVEDSTGRILEMVDEASAHRQLHPGAVYMHQGASYLVDDINLETRVARVALDDSSYYTEASETTEISIGKIRASKVAGGVGVWLGEVEVTNQVVGYRKRTPMTEEVLGDEPLDLPPRRFNTVALWFDIPQKTIDRCRGMATALAGGLHAAEHAAIGVLPLFALCDRNDIGGVSTPLHPDTSKPQVFIYDGHPGGVGIAEEGFRVIDALWEATLSVVSDCICETGCPSCIQSPKCGNNNHPLDKEMAGEMLKALCAG